MAPRNRTVLILVVIAVAAALGLQAFVTFETSRKAREVLDQIRVLNSTALDEEKKREHCLENDDAYFGAKKRIDPSPMREVGNQCRELFGVRFQDPSRQVFFEGF